MLPSFEGEALGRATSDKVCKDLINGAFKGCKGEFQKAWNAPSFREIHIVKNSDLKFLRVRLKEFWPVGSTVEGLHDKGDMLLSSQENIQPKMYM